MTCYTAAHFAFSCDASILVIFNGCPLCFLFAFCIVLMFGTASGNKDEVSLITGLSPNSFLFVRQWFVQSLYVPNLFFCL